MRKRSETLLLLPLLLVLGTGMAGSALLAVTVERVAYRPLREHSRLAVLITAGLDARFGWSAPFTLGLSVLGVIVAFGSQMFVLWAMASNPYFATTVRIQADRGHSVTKIGPYQLVRHPGYAGSLIYNLAIPFVLGSWWTFIPALFTIALTLVRTALEDQTLQNELPGYRDYAREVKYRLLPGIW